ncbi:2-iminoacetate synthase ThiH [Marinicrinis sediminis]|uniref:2-iminoacetate synthase ThiH n=1 Tax=Marinicrinis sediminis TaxID=1652465 RepID=A0ABW5R904_9BACL
MGFYETCTALQSRPLSTIMANMHARDVEKALLKSHLDEQDYLALLSPAAEPYLEPMAQKAHQLTIQHFGRAILLYAPLYVSDHCVNHCTYCSFSVVHDFPRKQLEPQQLEKEAALLHQAGLRHVLLLSGESPLQASAAYFQRCVRALSTWFPSVSLEVQPLQTAEYEALAKCGVEGLTVYQEVYDPHLYAKLHLKGPKRHYRTRIDTPERACSAGIPSVTIGALLGLGDARTEAFTAGLHARTLQSRYLETAIQMAFPRIRPHLGSFQPAHPVDDRLLTQIMLAYRLFMPASGITLSTRERAALRDQLLPLGVTKMSAASSTAVGGYALASETPGQFEISDTRTVAQVCRAIKEKGYQPVRKDGCNLYPQASP